MKTTLTAGASSAARHGGASTMAASRLSDKLASRNGPRHSVYWVQCKRKSSVDAAGTMTRRSSSVVDMGSAAGHVDYSVTGKYTGDWSDGEKHGYGVFLYANGSKYEGDWVRGKRQGKGTFWVGEKKKFRKQYAGEWHDDRRHGAGTFFFEDGGRYDGEWVRNKREGSGRMVYGEDQSVYDGQWQDNERSGHGIQLLPNGDRYDGHWLADKKEGPGRFFYKATRKVYEGEWFDGAPKCGTYHDDELPTSHGFDQVDAEDEDDETVHGRKAHDRFQIPELGLAHPARVVNESIAYIRQERILEQAFRAQQLGDSSIDGAEFDGEADANSGGADGERGDAYRESSVVFDDETMRVLQREFRAMEDTNGTIQCESLPQVLGVLGLPVEPEQILAFLDEIGATPETSISFAECVDIVSLLAESTMEPQDETGLSSGQGDDDEDED